jgi:hypothetical protein
MKNNPLTPEELEKLKLILDELEREVYDSSYYHRINGAFASAEMYDYDDEEIFIELKHGTQDETHSSVHTEQYTVNRETMKLIE